MEDSWAIKKKAKMGWFILLINILNNNILASSLEAKRLASASFQSVNVINPHPIVVEKLEQVMDSLLLVKEKNSNQDKFVKGVINFSIPEILFCNYKIAQDQNFFYYPLISKLSFKEKFKRFMKITFAQKAFKLGQMGGVKFEKNSQREFSANLFSFIVSLLNYTSFKSWDHFIYNLNCISGALVFNTKKYDKSLKMNISLSLKGILQRITDPYFSCISLTNFVIFMVDYLFKGSEIKKNTKSAGNSKHAYIATYSEEFPDKKIFIDPFVFYNKFSNTRQLWYEENQKEKYTDTLFNNFEAPLIGYEANKENFRGIFNSASIYEKKDCRVKFWVEVPPSNRIPNLEFNSLEDLENPQCVGSMYTIFWENPKSRKKQSLIFALLPLKGINKPLNVPSPKSSDWLASALIGDFKKTTSKWLESYFIKRENMELANFQVQKVESFEDFIKADIGDFSEFYIK